MEHQPVGAWPVASVEDSGARKGIACAVLCGIGASRLGGEVGTFHRTAVYVIRTHGGVGGEAP